MVEFSAFLSDNDAFFYELFCLMIVMRLLSSLKHDESERGIFHLGRALVKNGHTSIVVTSADPEHALVKRLERDGTIYHQLMMPKKSWWSLLQVIPLRRLIEKYNPDIIHVHSRTPAWILRWALKGARLKTFPKIVSTMYGFYPVNNYSRALLEADTIITVSDSVRDYLIKHARHTGLNMRKIVRIYRGVDTRRYPYRHNPSVYWLRSTFAEYPELEHKKWLLFPTIIGPEYGQEWLIDILGNLQEQFPNIHIIIMDDEKNDGDIFYDEFRQRAYALELKERITFVGSRRNDAREWLSAANIVLALANQPESIGINALQAIHLGTPVVGWDKAAFTEILQPLYPLGLVKQHTAKALCKAVRNQLEGTTRPAMTELFTMRQMIEETLQVYQQLCDERLEQEIIKANAKKTKKSVLKKPESDIPTRVTALDTPIQHAQSPHKSPHLDKAKELDKEVESSEKL